MSLYVGIGAVIICVGFIIKRGLFWKSPDPFPDEKFTACFKKYSRKEIAVALDGIGQGI